MSERSDGTPLHLIVEIDCRRITTWDTFHDVFAEAFGFPSFYGRNMDAWADCMSDLDDPGTGMSRIHVAVGGSVVLRLLHVQDFRRRCREQYDALMECSAFVNWRRVERGREAIIALAFYG